MNRTVFLVDLCWMRDKDPRLPLGHASLLASLRQDRSLDVRSVVVPVNGGQSSAAAIETLIGAALIVPAERVDVAIGAYVWGEHLVRELITELRSAGFEGRIILGGPQISHAGPGLEALYPAADAFIRGYGEQALAAVVSSAEPVHTPGAHWAGESDSCLQSNISLHALPSPLLCGAISCDEQDFVRWETQRGCPFRCAFCQHREAGAGLDQRFLGMDRIDAEIDLLCRGGVDDIAVLDPIFNAAPHATAVLQRFSERGFRGRLSLQCRAELIDDAFLDAAQSLDVRLEFGLQTTHPREAAAIRRRNSIDKIDRVLSEVRRRNIEHEVSLIFGLPRQTLTTFESSVRWCLERRVPVIKAFPLLLLRGTPLDLERDRWGLIAGPGPMPMVVQAASFDPSDWTAMAQLSDALSRTEGQHPSRLEDLRLVTARLRPTFNPWQPSENEHAA